MLLLNKARSSNVSYNHFIAGGWLTSIRHGVQIVGQYVLELNKHAHNIKGGEATKRALENDTVDAHSHFPEKILLV